MPGIDIVEHTLISAEDVAEIVPPRRRGRKMHRSTFHRWCTKDQNGVVLASLWIGGQRFTTVEALQEFFDRLTRFRSSTPSADRGGRAEFDHAAGAKPLTANDDRQRRVEAELERYGI